MTDKSRQIRFVMNSVCRLVTILAALTVTAFSQNPFAGRYEGPLTTTTLGQVAQIGQVIFDVNDAGEILSQEGTALFLRGLVSNTGAVALEANLFQLSSGQIVNDILTSTSSVTLPVIGNQITNLTLTRTGAAGGDGGNSGALPDPGVVGLAGYRDRLGETLQFEVTADPLFPFYGGDIYTDTSPLASTVVHAGLLATGETGVVSVKILPSPASYPAVEQNGLTSGFWPIATDGAYSFTDGETDSLAITKQPQSIEVLSGDTATFTITARGENLSYQWYQGTAGDRSTPVVDATNATLTVTDLTGDTGYWVEVISGEEILTSATASATIVTLPDNVTTVIVDAKASGKFGAPTSSAIPFVRGYEFTRAGESLAIIANGTATFGEGLSGGPNGLTTARSIIAGYTPLEEIEIDSGATTEAALPGQALNVGALIGAFIPTSRTSAPGFQPNDADTLANGIDSADLFLVGSISAFIAPEPGTLYLGINEAWMANNSGSFEVFLGAVETDPTSDLNITQDANGPWIEWSGEGTLRESTDMIDWTVIEGATSPYRFTYDGARYFQLQP